MKSLSQIRALRRRGLARRFGLALCCGLGLVFALGPIIHGLFHAGDLPHRHAAGSAHHHDSNQSHSHHAAGRHASDASNSVVIDRTDSSGRDRSDDNFGSDQRPTPSPTEEGVLLFLMLEVEASGTVVIDVGTCRSDSIASYIAFSRASFSPRFQLGVVSPRGPPTV